MSTPHAGVAGVGPQWLEVVERAMGIEPTAQAWEAWVLPLYDARLWTKSKRVAPGSPV
jgi:hypothetical protein